MKKKYVLLSVLCLVFAFKTDKNFGQSGNGHNPTTVLSYTPSGYATATTMRQDAGYNSFSKSNINNNGGNTDLFVNFTFDTSGMNVFVVYTTNGSIPTKSNGIAISGSFSNYNEPNRTWVVSIPNSVNTSGTTIEYVFYISNSDLASGFARVTPGGGYQSEWTEGDQIGFRYAVYESNALTGGDWSSNSTWNSSSIPNSSVLSVEIIGTNAVNLDQDTDVQNLNLLSGSILNLSGGFGLNVNGSLTNNGSIALNSTSTSYSSLIPTSVSGSGTVEYNRYTNSNTNGNDLIASPLSGGTLETFGSFEGNNSNLFADGTKRLFGPFDNTSNTYVEYDTSTDSGINLMPAKGYRAGTNPAGTLTFTGSINVSDQNINASSPAVPNGKWNLIGNPYPSYFNTNNFITTQDTKFPATYQAIYGWNGSAWTIINRLTSDDVLLAPGQGFFVASNGNQTFVFDAASRVVDSGNDFVTTRNANETNTGRAEISLNNGTKSMKTDIYFNDNSTSGLDPGYDAGAFGDSSSGLSIFTNLIMDNEGVDMAIQSLSYTDINNLVVPLGITALQGQQLTVSISINELPVETNVYLEDNVTSTWTLLNTDDYVFTPSTTLSGTGRFFLHFTTGTLSAEESILTGLQIYADNVSRSVVIKGQLNTGAQASVYDLQGRQVIKQELNSSLNTNKINVNDLSTGLYIVELSDFNKKRTQKVIIK